MMLNGESCHCVGRCRVLSLIFIAGLMLLSSCAGKPEKPPLKLTVEITASEDLNPGPGGEPLPVVLRLYQLKQKGSFLGADFYSLYDKESAVLGADLVAREEVTLRPSQVMHLQLPLDPAVAYVGVSVAYRAIDQSHWRAVLGLKAGVDNPISVFVKARAVTAAAK